MPIAAIGLGLGTAIAGGAAAGATVYGTRSAGKANRRASDITARANSDALAYQREQDALRKSEYDREQEEARRRWDTEETFRQREYGAREEERLAKEARAVPYRQASQAALARMGDLLQRGQVSPGAHQFMRAPAPMTLGALVKR